VLARAWPGGVPRLARDPLGGVEWAALEYGAFTTRGWALG
jgi:hypothetical protein